MTLTLLAFRISNRTSVSRFVNYPPATSYSKMDLLHLIARLRAGDQLALDECLDFCAKESFGIGHGRARAGMARVLKSVPLDCRQAAILVDTVCGRLARGEFSEQFKDQLNLAIRLDRGKVKSLTSQLLENPKSHVRRYARWTLERISRVEMNLRPRQATPSAEG